MPGTKRRLSTMKTFFKEVLVKSVGSVSSIPSSKVANQQEMLDKVSSRGWRHSRCNICLPNIVPMCLLQDLQLLQRLALMEKYLLLHTEIIRSNLLILRCGLAKRC